MMIEYSKYRVTPSGEIPTAFISYSTEDKVVAGEIQETLLHYKIESFLAHEDIQISEIWKARIISEIKKATVFLSILSQAFRKSDWASQEIGMAYSRVDEVLFIPISIDETIPFGFIDHIQGQRLSANRRNYFQLAVKPIIERFPRYILPKMIEELYRAGKFRDAESLILLLMTFWKSFTDDEVNAFAAASIENSQIWNANDCRRQYLPRFLNENGQRLDSLLRTVLEFQIREGRQFVAEG